MASYTPPLRDMHFVLHELLGVVDEFKQLPAHAEIDADTINAVLEEAGKFASEVLAPLNASGDAEGCVLDRETHAVRTPDGFNMNFSTLSLMLQNLPVHYQDPQFREDALRGISKTVTRINETISRLNELRHELALQPVECDLNDLITETLKGQEQAADISLLKELAPLPKVRLDPAQIQKVITNLVLNARDAVSSSGQIRVATSQENGWVILVVADNGCGMTPEFIQRSLFRPFHTTKQKGIGIGMFHCKMIVEAHRGRIEVQSEPGKGTRFRVLLPI